MGTAIEMDRIETAMRAAVADGGVQAASLAVWYDGEPACIAVGMANAGENIAATPDTLFHIGSVTKSFTAELVWKQIHAGRLSLDTAVVDALPEIARIDGLHDRRLNVRHLLTHTSGIDGDIIFEAGRDKDVLRRFLSRIDRMGVLFEPGAHFSYANVGFALLGRIVELTAQAPFENALRTMLRDDYGLSEFGILPEEKLMFRTAIAMMPGPSGAVADAPGPYSNIASGTVLAMSMRDLVRWGTKLGLNTAGEAASAHMTGRAARDMRALAANMPFSHRYDGWGHGFMLFREAAPSMFGHDGGTAGTSTFLRIVPDRGAVWALSATGKKAGALYRTAERDLLESFDLGAALRTPPPGACASDLSIYHGRYGRNGMIFDVVPGIGGGLELRAGGEYAQTALHGQPLTPLRGHVFEVRLPDIDAVIWVSFHDFGPDGRPNLFFALERMARRVEGAGS